MGTRVRLPDGTTGLAYRDVGIGRPWDGTYIVAQNLHGIERRDGGWRREHLEVVPCCAPAVHSALVADDAAWALLELAGLQAVEADGDEPGYTQEVRFCHCGSTLARQVTP